MAKTNNIQCTGEILEALSNANFRVLLENGNEVRCFLSGKMRTNFIKVIPGDKVGIEFSPYDLSIGRIYKRYK